MLRAKWSLAIGLWLSLPLSSLADDFTGPRPLGMGGAHRAVATNNDAIYLNPAGMSLFPRYSFEVNYLFSPDYGTDHGPDQHVFNASVVDNQIQTFATGLAYTRVEREDHKKGNRFDLAFSFPVSENLLLGTNVKYLNFDKNGKENAVDAVSADLGLLLRFVLGEDSSLAFGVTGYNLTNTADYLEHPISMAAAAMFSPFGSLELAFDWFINFQKPQDLADPLGDKDTGFGYHFGAEYLLLSQFTLRLGYEISKAWAGVDDQYWSAGVGYVNPRVALDFGFRGSIKHGWDNVFGVGIRLFM